MNEKYSVELTEKQLKAVEDACKGLSDGSINPNNKIANLYNDLRIKFHNAQPVQPSALERLEAWADQSPEDRTWEVKRNGAKNYVVILRFVAVEPGDYQFMWGLSLESIIDKSLSNVAEIYAALSAAEGE